MAAKSQKSVTEEIPEILRNQMDNPEILTSLLPAYLTDLPLEEAIHFINGALDHQNSMDLEETKWFKFKLDSVEVIERKYAGDKLLGRKLRLHFMGTNYRSNEEEAQFIDTGWLEFFGWNQEQFAWEKALANTLKNIAEDAIGKTVVAQKVVYETDDGKARFLSNLRIMNNQDDDDEDKGGGRKSGGPSRRGGGRKSGGAYGSKDEVSDRIDAAADDLDKNDDVTEEDVTFLRKLFSDGEMTDAQIWDHLAEYLDVDLKNPKNESDDQIVWAIQLILENV